MWFKKYSKDAVKNDNSIFFVSYYFKIIIRLENFVTDMCIFQIYIYAVFINIYTFLL